MGATASGGDESAKRRSLNALTATVARVGTGCAVQQELGTDPANATAIFVSHGWPIGQQSVLFAAEAHATAAGTTPARLNSRTHKIARRRGIEVTYRGFGHV